jgi:hypothetical protein
MALHHVRGNYEFKDISLFSLGESYIQSDVVAIIEQSITSSQQIQDIQPIRNSLETQYLERMIASAGYYSLNGAPISCLAHYGTRTRKPHSSEIIQDIKKFGENVLSQDGHGTKVKIKGKLMYYDGAPRILAGIFTTAIVRDDTISLKEVEDLEKIISRGEPLDHEGYILVRALYGAVNIHKFILMKSMNGDGIDVGSVSLHGNRVIFSSTNGVMHDYSHLL